MTKPFMRIISEMFRPRSSIEALKKLLPGTLYRQLLMITPDRRMCFESASSLTSRPISEIVEKAAALLGHSALPRISPISKEMLSRIPNIDRLRLGAAIPLCASTVVSGVVCVDPALMRAVIPEFAALPVFLASWSDIKAALDSQPIESKDVAQESPLLTQVLHHLIGELHQHHKERCTIRIDDEITYSIPLTDSKHAEGSIHPSVKNDLKISLKDFAEQNKKYTHLETGDVYTISGQDGFFEISKFNRSVSSANVIEFPQYDEQSIDQQTKHEVLLIDDNATFARVLDKFLLKHGYSTQHIQNGADALEALRAGLAAPSLIVCDIHMPVMNGFEFVRSLRLEEKLKLLPILMLTSDGDVEAEITLLSYGVEAFIGKNEDPRILCMHVKRILERLSQKAA